MNFYNICIPTFINPHLFWIVDVSTKEREVILKRINEFCHNYFFDELKQCFEIGEFVLIKQNKKYHRAVIQEVYFNGDSSEPNKYSCWLLDYGKVNITNKVYDMPEELSKIDPLARQASLYNVAYYTQKMEVGVTTKIQKSSSIMPTPNATESSLECLKDATKIQFSLTCNENDILYGDIIIVKKSETIHLTQYLCDHGLLCEDKECFQKIIENVEIYKKTHMGMIQEMSTQQTGFSGHLPSINLQDICRDFEESDAYHTEPILTGRRKTLNTSSGSEHSSSSSSKQDISVAKQRLLSFIKSRMASDQDASNPIPDLEISTNDVRKKRLLALQRKSKSLEKKGANENSNDQSTDKDVFKKTSSGGFEEAPKKVEAKKIPNNAIFGPAGYKFENAKSSSKPSKKKRRISTSPHAVEPLKSSESEGISETLAISETTDSEPVPAVTKSETSSQETDGPGANHFPEALKHNMGCQCKNCYFWTVEDNWETDVYFEEEKKIEEKPNVEVRKPPLLLRNKDEECLKREIATINYSSMSRIQNMATPKLLVHGEVLPGPIHQVAKAPFHEDIQTQLGRLKYVEAKKIQIYTWPALFRGQHVFLVGDPKSGKTMSYLPVVCSFILEKEERYKPLFKMGGGPIVIILCDSSKKCEDVHDFMRVLFGKTRVRLSLVTYPAERVNTSHIDVLVTMPTILAGLILTRAINFKRLCHFILEDGDSLLKHHNSLITKFTNLAQDMLEHRSCEKTVQLIVCSEHWNVDVEAFSKKLRRVPLVVISNYIEAAMYGKVTSVLKLLDSTRKEFELKNILGERFKFEKSIILCEDQEVEEIQTMLMYKGIEYMGIKQNMDLEDMLFIEEIWNMEKPGSYTVLICSDSIFNSIINVTSADLLIHYTLPNTWTQFVRRFWCFLENCKSPFDSIERKAKCRSVVFIDETCEKMMVKFLNLLKNSEQQLPANVESYLEGIRIKQESEKIARDVELCDNLQLFGNCDEVRCSDRHKIDVTLDESDFLPSHGVLKFKITEIQDVAIFKIEAIEYTDFDNKTTKIVNRSKEMQEVLSEFKRERVKTPCIGHNYMYIEDDVICRCKVLSSEKGNVTIALIDDNKSDVLTSIRHLYKLPAEYKNMRPQTNFATMYLANLIPPHKDQNFSTKAFRLLEETMQQKFYRDSIFRGRICLRLGNTFWLKNVEEEREMFDKDLPSSGFQLTSEVMVRKFAVLDETQLENLYKLCTEAGMILPKYEPVKKVRNVAQPKPQWAFLDANGANEVIFNAAVSPDEFYVRLNKFDKQLSNLQNEINRELRKPFYPKIEKIIEGNVYLAKESEGDQYCRALLKKMENDQCLCLFVDYGDEIVIKTADLKFLPDKLITKLPFQSIQCSLHGIKPVYDQWSNDEVDILYQYALEPNSDIFRSLFIKVCSREENLIIPSQKNYSVLLKDGYGEKKVLINKILVECGYALETTETLEDFVLPEINPVKSDSEEDIEKLDIRRDLEEDEESEECNVSDGFDVVGLQGMDDMELNLGDPNKFMLELINLFDNKGQNAVEFERDLPNIKALPPVDYSTPLVYWSQTEDVVKLTIDLPDTKEYTVAVLRNRMFNFSCEKDGKPYKLNLMLFETVDKTFQHSSAGFNVRVTLSKVKKGLEWPRLLVTSEKARHIRYDVSTIAVEAENERRPLDLNMGDDESESDGEIDMMYTVVSDMDSDYDCEIPMDRD